MSGQGYVYRARIAERTAYEQALVDRLFEILSRGVHDLPMITAALAASNVMPPDGGAWTPELLRAEIARLGVCSAGGPPPPARR